MTAARLTPALSNMQRATLPSWTHDAQRDAIARHFVFADFTLAFAFMTAFSSPVRVSAQRIVGRTR